MIRSVTKHSNGQALGFTVKILLTSGLAASAIWFTVTLSWNVAWLYTLIFFFVTFLAPALLMWAQKYKK